MIGGVSIDRPREQDIDDHSGATDDSDIDDRDEASRRTGDEASSDAGRRASAGSTDGEAGAGSADDGASPAAEPEIGAEAPESYEAPRRTLPILLAIAAVVFALDLGSKALVVANMTPGEPVSIIGDVVRLTLVRNPGAAFSMATGMTWLLTLIAAAVVVGVIRIGRSLRSVGWSVGLGLVLGGAVGNLVDRLFRAPGPLQGHVVDFISVTKWWPVFNLADSSIVCGAILLVVLTVFGFEPDGRHARSQEAGAEDDAA